MTRGDPVALPRAREDADARRGGALHADRLRPRDGADPDRAWDPGRTAIYGVVNIIADPDNERAEYAIIVRHDMTALGLGTFLMRRIVDYARARGIGEIYGDVLHENGRC